MESRLAYKDRIPEIELLGYSLVALESSLP